ncbi:unnamed protein product, partial [Arabidopsis halleri]
FRSRVFSSLHFTTIFDFLLKSSQKSSNLLNSSNLSLKSLRSFPLEARPVAAEGARPVAVEDTRPVAAEEAKPVAVEDT